MAVAEEPAVLVENSGLDDDDDDMANLFSFGSGDGIERTDEGTHSKGISSISPSTAADVSLSPFSLGVSANRADSGANSPDSFLELLTSESGGRISEEGGGLPLEEHDPETRDILMWLENMDESDETEVVVFTSKLPPPQPQPMPIPYATVVALPPTFKTLKDALASKDSTVHQIRLLYQKEQEKVDRSDNSSNDEDLSAVVGTERAELYCRMICHKSLNDVLKTSLADSFEQWKASVQLEGDKVSDDVYKSWLRPYQSLLATRIAQQTNQSQRECEDALVDLLLYHQHQNTTAASSPSSWTGGHGSVGNDAPDVLLPMVATTILSAGPMPVAAAAVMLSQIVPNFMPLLALSTTPVDSLGGTGMTSERWEASLLLHAEFYLLACYHIPLLVFHLDRYMPGWHWPMPIVSTAAAAGGGNVASQGMEADMSGATAIGRNLHQQGQIPPSWLLSHLAGECGGLWLPARALLKLWDGILTGQNNAIRFFLVLAVLERNAASLLLRVGDDLAASLRRVWTLQGIDDHKESDDREWLFEWWPLALGLQQATPDSVLRRLQKVEDEAIQASLRQRQERAEAALRARLEAEAASHKEAQELKAEEARQRLSRARLVAFYRKHAPEKESNIDKILETYNGRLDVLDAKLKGIYGEGFSPALKAKPPTLARTSSKLLATMNQGLGRKKAVAENHDEFVERRPDFVSVTVTPQEVIPVICWSKEATAARGVNYSRRRTNGRAPLKFYLVDSRSEELAKEQGRFPTAVSLSPEALLDPERLQQNEEMFESLRGAVHIVVMGEGFNAIPSLYNQKLSPKLQELMEQDESRTNSCALFFQKRGFCFVSLLDGGFCAAHSWLMREGSKHHLSAAAVLVDYTPDTTLFGQLEALHNASAAEKAQRKMASLIEASMVTMTKRAYQLEKLASEIDPSEVRQGLRLNLFRRGEAANSGESSDVAQSPPSMENEEGGIISHDAGNSDGTLTEDSVNDKQAAEQRESAAKIQPSAPAVPSLGKFLQGGSGPSGGREETPAPSNPFRGFGAAFNQTRARFTANAGNVAHQPETAPGGVGAGITLGVGASGFGFNQLRKTAMARVARNTAGSQDEPNKDSTP
jgi:hypothetical protein